jgi:flagellar basal body rod protein FlgG
MDYGLYVAASGADSQSRRMEVISHNLANIDTVGFKSEFAALEARYSRAVQDGTAAYGAGGLDDMSGGVSLGGVTMTDFTPGTYQQTGGSWDVAIKGDGFFMVRDAANRRDLLTRAGNFEVNANGELLTPQGYQVLDVEGGPIVVDPRSAAVHQDGWIVHAAGAQQLAVVKPASLGDLSRVGNNTFYALGPVAAVAPEERRVAPGFLENSGVTATQAMMELIETSRMYEANIKMIQNHDQMTGSLVNRVLSNR